MFLCVSVCVYCPFKPPRADKKCRKEPMDDFHEFMSLRASSCVSVRVSLFMNLLLSVSAFLCICLDVRVSVCLCTSAYVYVDLFLLLCFCAIVPICL